MLIGIKQKLLGFIFLFVGAISLISAYPVHAIDSQGTFLGNFGLDCLGMILECKHNGIGGHGEQGPEGTSGPVAQPGLKGDTGALGSTGPAGPVGPVGTQGVTDNSPGVLSGNSAQVPNNLPINLCGNTVDVIGLLNPAFGNTCTNTG